MSKLKLVGVKVKRPATKKADADIKWHETPEFTKLQSDMKAAAKKFGSEGTGSFKVEFSIERYEGSKVAITAAINGPEGITMYILNNNIFAARSYKANMDDVKVYLDKLTKQTAALKQTMGYADKMVAKFQKQLDSFPPEILKAMKF